jgi:hypothetical protein
MTRLNDVHISRDRVIFVAKLIGEPFISYYDSDDQKDISVNRW